MKTYTDILAALGLAGLILGFLAWPAAAVLRSSETLRRRCKATWIMHALGVTCTVGLAIHGHAARWPDVYWTAIPILSVGLVSLAALAALTGGEMWRRHAAEQSR